MPYHLMLASTTPFSSMFQRSTFLLSPNLTWTFEVFVNLLFTFLVSFIYSSINLLTFYHECRSLIGHVTLSSLFYYESTSVEPGMPLPDWLRYSFVDSEWPRRVRLLMN